MEQKEKWEYFRAIYERYRQAGRRRKHAILNAFRTSADASPVKHNERGGLCFPYSSMSVQIALQTCHPQSRQSVHAACRKPKPPAARNNTSDRAPKAANPKTGAYRVLGDLGYQSRIITSMPVPSSPLWKMLTSEPRKWYGMAIFG